jgi:hypothetical protein
VIATNFWQNAAARDALTEVAIDDQTKELRDAAAADDAIAAGS